MSEIPEKCFTCDHFDLEHGVGCKRVMKMALVVGNGGGSINLETMPGVLPEEMEYDFAVWVQESVDAWPGWKMVHELLLAKHEKENECAARRENPFQMYAGLKLV